MSGSETCIGAHCVDDDILGPIMMIWGALSIIFFMMPLYSHCLNWWIGLFRREDE